MSAIPLGIGLLLVLQRLTVLGQPIIPSVSSSNYGPPARITASYASVNPATTPIVVLNTTGFVGTSAGILGGSILGGTTPSFVFPTPYPVTALFNTSATQMIAIANDTIYAFNGNVSAWTFTQSGYQFDFAASMTGQYPKPLWWNSTLYIGTGNNYYSDYSVIFAIDLATGMPLWNLTIPVKYTNYPIQLGNDLKTLVVRGSTPSYIGDCSTLYILDSVSGTMGSFTYGSPDYDDSPSSWLPQFSLYNGTLWVSDYLGTNVMNLTTGGNQHLNYFWSYSTSGFSPLLKGNVVYVVADSRVYSFGAWNFSTLSISSSAIGTLQQVVPYTATQYVFGGPYGLQTYDTTLQNFTYTWFTTSANDCEGLTWAPNGLLVANFGSNVYGINVTSGNVSWQMYGAGAMGPVIALTVVSGLTYAVGTSAMLPISTVGATTLYEALTSWQQSPEVGWVTPSSLNPSGFTFIGAPYNVVVVQSAYTNQVTVLGAFTGSVLGEYPVAVSNADRTPVHVGDFACSNSYYGGYVYCVPIVAGKQAFKAPYSGGYWAYPFTVRGTVLYRTSEDRDGSVQIDILDTSAATPASHSIALPSALSGCGSNGPVLLARNTSGQTVICGASDNVIYCINTAIPAATWVTSTLAVSVMGTALFGATFYTRAVQIPGDSNVLVGGYTTSVPAVAGASGVFKFSVSLGSFVAFYTFPSVQEDPVALLTDSNVVLIVGTYNITACDANGNLYWSQAFSSVGTIAAVNLQLSEGAVFVTTVGNYGKGSVLNTLDAYTGALAWSTPISTSTSYAHSVQTNTQWSSGKPSGSTPAFAVNGLVFYGGATLYIAEVVTGALVATYWTGPSSSPIGLAAGNSSEEIWAFGGINNTALFGVSLSPSVSGAQSFSGYYGPTNPGTLGPSLENKLWIIGVVVAFLVIAIVVAVVVWRKKGATKEQNYVAIATDAGEVYRTQHDTTLNN